MEDWRPRVAPLRPQIVQQIKMRLDQLGGDAARQIKLIAPALDAAREIKIDNLATQFEAMHWGEASSRHDYTERIRNYYIHLQARYINFEQSLTWAMASQLQQLQIQQPGYGQMLPQQQGGYGQMLPQQQGGYGQIGAPLAVPGQQQQPHPNVGQTPAAAAATSGGTGSMATTAVARGRWLSSS